MRVPVPRRGSGYICRFGVRGYLTLPPRGARNRVPVIVATGKKTPKIKKSKIQAREIEVDRWAFEAAQLDLAERSARAAERSARAEEMAANALQTIATVREELQAMLQELRVSAARAEGRLEASEKNAKA